MKKLCWIFLVLFLVGCSQQLESNIILPPTRVGKATAKVELADKYDMDSAVSESDMIAHVRNGTTVYDRIGILKESIPNYSNPFTLEQLEKVITEKVGN